MPTLTWDDLAAIQREVPTVQYAAPQLRTNAQVISEEQNWTTSVTGTTPDYFVIRSWPIGVGRDVQRRRTSTAATKVVVLGQTVVDKLFGPNADPVGQTVRIRNIPFQVVGVLARKGQSPTGQDYDDSVFIPSTTFMTKIQGGLKKYLQGTIMVERRVRRTTTVARRSVRSRRCCASATTCPRAPTTTSRSATWPRWPSAQQEGTRDADHAAGQHRRRVAAGGRHRHHEHHAGQRDRADARDRRCAWRSARSRFDILTQFLVEALTLSIAGGLVGVALGLAIGAAAGRRASAGRC